jgi:hypothetical protein
MVRNVVSSAAGTETGLWGQLVNRLQRGQFSSWDGDKRKRQRMDSRFRGNDRGRQPLLVTPLSMLVYAKGLLGAGGGLGIAQRMDSRFRGNDEESLHELVFLSGLQYNTYRVTRFM